MMVIVQGLVLWLFMVQVSSAATLELDNEPLPPGFYLAPYVDRYVGDEAPGDIRNAEALPSSDYV